MKFKCEICGSKVETNDAVFELHINVSTLRQDEELGDYVYSPIYSKKICSLCANWMDRILSRGIKEVTSNDN